VEVSSPLSVGQGAPAVSPPFSYRERPKSEGGKSIHDEVQRILLQRYSPPGVLVDQNFHIVQFRGQTGRFLEPPAGEPSLNILKMAREGLLYPLRSALNTAKRRHRTVRKEKLQARYNGDWREVSIEVIPVGPSTGAHLLVLFEEHVPSAAVGKASRKETRGEKASTGQTEKDGRVDGLTRELAASREYLQ
jgi:two-component system CheB/CheR fusion protein